jgi:hypothetical protein
VGIKAARMLDEMSDDVVVTGIKVTTALLQAAASLISSIVMTEIFSIPSEFRLNFQIASIG